MAYRLLEIYAYAPFHLLPVEKRRTIPSFALAHIGQFFRALASRLPFIFAAYLIGFIIESDGRRIESIPSRKEVLLNSAHVLVYTAAELSVGVMTIYCLQLLFDNVLHYKAPIHFRGGAFEIFALSCLAIVASDFFTYWLHRLQHASRWLWAEHELHHSDEHVNVTTSFRHHWLDTVLYPLFVLTPVFLLFNPTMGPVIWLAAFPKVMNYVVHLNFPLGFGWFNRVLTSPKTHRIHHSNLPEHMNKNFAGTFPLWDILFGTYHHPEEHEWPSTGVSGVKVTSLWQAIVLPFVSWGRMLRAEKNDDGGARDSELVNRAPGVDV
jgi:sterol desaturase/sphingolipid hydroxylase (fatty acid hydroxylase superfamily)